MIRRPVGGFVGCAAALISLVALDARAQPPAGGDEDLPTVLLSGAGVEMLKLALPRAEGDPG